MAEKYYKVAESLLVDIADAVRFQKKLTRKYTLKEIPVVIKAMLVLPSDYASTKVSIGVDTCASAVLPVVRKASVTESVSYTAMASVSAVVVDVQKGMASVATNMTVQTDAVGVLTE